ncbi:Sec-independent protein translocase subunit TatA [Streptomyces sp. DSM 44917]|uniref:Sec-independent protein translocase protein TatA n=1 Tax=Streptomyces boetiae TaxID=3075541 RepID=A0ABU2L335_9ACTN|nr:Sec-independent protein translocase subunit TatA [Streptomyces sp. DSM 44917]MDT0305973.1 Sec-independent protein translocase subunit TatA [Streptomyces sp. DSM 44917]
MGSFSAWHLLLVALVVIVVFGSKRLPDTARALGKSMRILKSETAAMKQESGQNAAPQDAGAAAPAQRTIQSAPGDTAGARPVEEPEPRRTAQG